MSLISSKHSCYFSIKQTLSRPRSTIRLSTTILLVATGTQWSGPMKSLIVGEFLGSHTTGSDLCIWASKSSLFLRFSTFDPLSSPSSKEPNPTDPYPFHISLTCLEMMCRGKKFLLLLLLLKFIIMIVITGINVIGFYENEKNADKSMNHPSTPTPTIPPCPLCF